MLKEVFGTEDIFEIRKLVHEYLESQGKYRSNSGPYEVFVEPDGDRYTVKLYYEYSDEPVLVEEFDTFEEAKEYAKKVLSEYCE